MVNRNPKTFDLVGWQEGKHGQKMANYLNGIMVTWNVNYTISHTQRDISLSFAHWSNFLVTNW